MKQEHPETGLFRSASLAKEQALSPLLRFDRVTVCMQGKTLLAELSFALFAGEKTGLSGKSGSGKSSVLKTVLGLYPLDHGTVYFQGNPLSPSIVQAIRSCTAYIGQEPIMGAERVRDALLLPFQFKAHRAGKPAEAQLIEVLQRLHLPQTILQQESNRISGGEKQRIALARGLLLGKTLYLLDEVTSALDAESKRAVFEVFADPGLTVLSVAHDPEWLEHCSQVLELEEGRLIKR